MNTKPMILDICIIPFALFSVIYTDELHLQLKPHIVLSPLSATTTTESCKLSCADFSVIVMVIINPQTISLSVPLTFTII